MNKKIAIPAIAMFAITMGLAVLNPAIATKPVDGEHKVEICHFAEAENIFNATGDGMWHNSTAGMEIIEIDNAGKMNGHFDKLEQPRHGNGTHHDYVINATALPEEWNSAESCGPEPVLTIG